MLPVTKEVGQQSCCIGLKWQTKLAPTPGWEEVPFPHSPALSWSITSPSAASCPRHLFVLSCPRSLPIPLYRLCLWLWFSTVFLSSPFPVLLPTPKFTALLSSSSLSCSHASFPAFPNLALPQSVPLCSSHCFHCLCHKHSFICYNIFVILVIEWDINR